MDHPLFNVRTKVKICKFSLGVNVCLDSGLTESVYAGKIPEFLAEISLPLSGDGVP